MTKKEFAARLLFWLLPWPFSYVLPRAIRIYYFGPGAQPPPGYEPPFVPPPDWTPDPYIPPVDPEPPPGPPTPPGPGWLTVFDETYWDPVLNCAWTGTYWRATGGTEAHLAPKGTWAFAFRPDLLEVTYANDISSIRIVDASNNKLSFAYSNPPKFNCEFPWVYNYDIALIKIFFTGHGFNITNLRFLTS